MCQMDHCRACECTERYAAGSGLAYGYPLLDGVLALSVDALELVHLGLEDSTTPGGQGTLSKRTNSTMTFTILALDAGHIEKLLSSRA